MGLALPLTLLHVLAFAATAHAQITWPDLTTWCDLWRSDKVCEGYQTRYVEADCPTYAPYDCVWSTTECEMSAADTADWDYGGGFKTTLQQAFSDQLPCGSYSSDSASCDASNFCVWHSDAYSSHCEPSVPGVLEVMSATGANAAIEAYALYEKRRYTCRTNDESTCDTVDGCRWEGCGGTSSSNWQACQAKDETTCEADNCAWDFGTNTCSGSNPDCANAADQGTCQNVLENNCRWRGCSDDHEYGVIQVATACEAEYSVTDLDLIAKGYGRDTWDQFVNGGGGGGSMPSGHSPSCEPTHYASFSGSSLVGAYASSSAPFTADGVYYALFVIQFGDASQLSTLLLWGGDPNDYSCGAWRGGLLASTGAMYMDSQCNGPRGNQISGSVSTTEALTLNAQYVVEFYYDSVNSVARMWKTCLGGCGSHEVQGEVVETTQSGGEIVTLIFSDGPISIGYDAHADSAADFQGMVFEAAFYDCEQSSSSGPPPSTIAYAFEPDCAAVANATSQAQALKVIDTEYAFDRAGSYVYVRADATTADTLSGWQDLFLWGGTVQCDGLFFGLDNGQLFVGQQCNSAIYAVDLAEFAPAASTRYVFEVYFRDATNELRIWVDEIEVTPSGGTTFDLTWTDGYASLGYGAHNNYIEPWGGTVHDLSFYECVAPTSAGPPPAAGPFTSSANLKSAVDNCIAATVNPDLTLYPSCVATDVPPGSGRFCCSLCGADCLDGGATDMPDWNVSQVTSFYGLFDGKGDFDEDLSSWDVSSVTNMERTFLGASAFNSPIGDWNVASVTTMDSMFQDASAFDANITGWSSPQSSQNMFLGAAAFLARFANCGVGTPDATVCLRDTYPQSSAAYDGPAAAWDSRFCDFSALAPADGGLGECDAQVPKGTMCAPTCADPSALAMKGVCGKVTIPPACVCECAEKRAMFGFNV